jgi:hypothetical protein
MLLAESGLIAESMDYLTKVANEKDLPLLWLEASDFLKREKGMNWVPEGNAYDNAQLWNTTENKAAIE